VAISRNSERNAAPVRFTSPWHSKIGIEPTYGGWRLFRSAEHGHAHVVRALIPITADADRAALEGHRAIHIAACNGHTYGATKRS